MCILWILGHFACLSIWILQPMEPNIYLIFWRGNTFFCTWPAIFYFNMNYFFSDEVISPRGYFPFLYQDPSHMKDERHNLSEVINGVCLGTVVSLALKESCFTRRCLKLDNGLWLFDHKQTEWLVASGTITTIRMVFLGTDSMSTIIINILNITCVEREACDPLQEDGKDGLGVGNNGDA